MNRTLYIGNPAHLRCQRRQLEVIDPDTREPKGTAPIEDLAFVVLDHPRITLTHHLMVALHTAGCALISCDERHMPHALTLPFAGHSEHSERVRRQAKVSKPLRKNLWKQTVEAKIHNQARVLERFGEDASVLWDCVRTVRSGDTTNREGTAAKAYWPALLGDFTRERYGEAPNHLLNYGYAILRALVARALSATGLHLALGIHHRNKYNPACLADDVMEPYRPYVDLLVMDILGTHGEDTDLDPATKKRLLSLMTVDVRIDHTKRPLQVATAITATSVQHCLVGTRRVLRYPML